MKKRRVTLSLLLVLAALCCQAQAPNWSVNPNAFQYDMTVTAVLEVNCVELSNPSNRLGAFHKGVLRGTAQTLNIVGGRYMATMTIYSNQISAEDIEFRFYDVTADSIYNSIDSAIFQDNAIYGTPSIPLIIRTNHAPTQIILSNDSIQENQPSAQLVGTLMTTDLDTAQTHTYTLISGNGSTDNALFSISANQLLADFTADFELKNSYTIRLQTQDSEGCAYEEEFTIGVQNLNDPPIAISLSNTLMDENNLPNVNVGTLSAIDSDANEQFTYALVNGAGGQDNAAFSIAGNLLRTGVSFDFETKDEYAIRVQVSDKAANTYVDTFKILVNNLNEAPTDILLTSDSILENQAINSIVGTLSTVDEDVGQSFSYRFANIPGNDNSNFNLVGNTLRTTSTFDYESLDLYFIYIETNDLNGGLFTKPISIRIIDGNDIPSDIQLSSSAVDENLPIGSFVGNILSSDQDTGSTFSYKLVSGVGDVDNSNFRVSNDSLLTNVVFNFNTQSSQNIRIQTTDNNGGSFEKAFTIQITDVNNTPSALFLSNSIVAESTTLGSTVGSFTTSDADVNDIHNYTLVSGIGDEDNGNFLITGADLKTDTVFDVNVKNRYNIRVRSTDLQGAFVETALVINIINSNDAPTDISISQDTINENLLSNALVGMLSTVDPDTGDTHTYTFANLSANDNNSFVLVGNELRTASVFDFETKSVYFVQLQTTDASGGSFSKQLQINIADTNDAPTDILLSNTDVDEKQSGNQYVGNLSTVDQDADDSYTYSLAAGTGATDNASFLVRNDSLFATTSFDVLNQTSLRIRLKTTDAAGSSFEKSVIIAVNNVNDAPSAIDLTGNSIPENATLNTTVGSFTTTDLDPNQTFTYQLVSGLGDDDNANFTISGNELKSNVAFDYNSQRIHSIRISSTDQGGLSVQQVFIIHVLNSNDAPTDISLSPNGFKENLPQSSLIGLLSSTDKDSSDSFTYSFVNQGTNDNAFFLIANNELRTSSVFDFETQSLYVIEVQTRDNSGLTFTRQLTVNVLDSNDVPTAITISSDSLIEKSLKGTFVANLLTTDQDQNDVFTYSLVAGQGSVDNGLFRINGNLLESDSLVNFNNASFRRIRIRSTDQGGGFIENSFIVRIINQNDAPTNILLSDTSLNEAAPVGTTVGVLSTVDEDASDTFTYALVSGMGDADNNNFLIDGNRLQSNSSFDFETQTSYSIRVQTIDRQGAAFQKVFIIQLTNGNESPTIDNQSFILTENNPPNQMIGTVAAKDIDLNETFTFRIITDQNSLSINALTGELFALRLIDYETNPSLQIEVEVEDSGNLKDTATISIEVLDQVEGTLPATSFISPNGDGKNDNWKIENVELYTQYRLQIFSANGQIVYEIPGNYSNDWDGTINGSQLPDGIYYYYLENTTNNSQNFKGIITLKR